ncbi:aldo/keto reductase [Asanoa iriomotensis]|uniref:Oxidoreductase n=1 Tax=Asanoa iriomotensis TaxID=234613 RepID=A0ABQ4C7F9_9ACTN|nr:aldo/keto reductase [Asanoa iriomotensis]GIF58695.1 oxidoreductase [Asanoa iriomotensis]
MPNASSAGTIDVGGDLTVNRFGYGAMRITGPGIWGPPADKDQAIAVLRRVVDAGVNFIDTADSYGPSVSEELIAQALYPYPDDLVIATKGGLLRPEPFVPWPADGRPEHLREVCEGSLRRLRIEQIPLYQFHRPDPNVPFEDSIGELVKLKDEGKIRHIGLSNVDEEQIRAAQRLTPIVSIQNRYNVDDRASETIVDLCEQESMVFLPWAPIQDLDKNQTIHEIAERHNASARQVVLAWLLGRSSSMLPIPGTGDLAHLEDNLAALDLELSQAEIASLTRA